MATHADGADRSLPQTSVPDPNFKPAKAFDAAAPEPEPTAPAKKEN